MSGSRKALENAVREALGGAYRYGAVAMSMNGSTPLGYPEETRDTEALLGAVDRYANAAVRRAVRQEAGRG